MHTSSSPVTPLASRARATLRNRALVSAVMGTPPVAPGTAPGTPFPAPGLVALQHQSPRRPIPFVGGGQRVGDGIRFGRNSAIRAQPNDGVGIGDGAPDDGIPRTGSSDPISGKEV